MVDTVPAFRANALRPFAAHLRATGVEIHDLFEEAAIPVAALDDDHAIVPAAAAYRLLEAAIRREKLPELPALVARKTSAFALGSYGRSLRYSPTVREYVRRSLRDLHTHSSATQIWLTREESLLRIHFSLQGPEVIGRCAAELYSMLLTISTFRLLLGDESWLPHDVGLRERCESMTGGALSDLSAATRTGASHSSFTLPLALLDQTVRTLPRGKESFPQPQPLPTNLRDCMTTLIAELLRDGACGLRETAAASGSSPRTLQRQLQAAGLSYSALLEHARITLARDQLATSKASVTDIALALGYTDSANFARAFRRATGESPTSYRLRSCRPK